MILGSLILGFILAEQVCQTMIAKEFVVDPENMTSVVGIMIGVWGTLLGFIITAESILIAFNSGTITNEFKQTRHYMTVICQYTQTSIKLLAYIIVFVAILVAGIFTMREMFVFIYFTIMTAIDVLICFGILILMLIMANK